MSGAFYSNMVDLAGDLLDRFGKSITLRVQTVTTPAKAYRPVITNTDHTIQVAPTEFHATEIDGTLVMSGDRRYLVAAEGMTVTPDPKNLLVDGSEILEILSVERVSPGGTEVIYKIHARPTGGGS